MYQAFSFATNQSLPIGTQVAGTIEGTNGERLPSTEGTQEIYRTGEFYKNPIIKQEYGYSSSSHGKPMYENWKTAVYKRDFRETPHGAKMFTIDED